MATNDIFTDVENQDMAYTRGVRLNIIKDLTSNGTPTNTRELELLLGALKDSEDNSVKKARLRLSSKKDEDETEVSRAMVAAMLTNVPSIPEPMEEADYKEVKELPQHIEDNATFVEGEMEKAVDVIDS